MFSVGSIFFHLKVAPMRIENIFKDNLIVKLTKFCYANLSVLKSPIFYDVKIKWLTVLHLL